MSFGHSEDRMLYAWEFFALCPRCRQSGEPRTATSYQSAAGQQTTVTYWCAGCDQSWNVSANDDESAEGDEPLMALNTDLSTSPDSGDRVPAPLLWGTVIAGAVLLVIWWIGA